MLSLHAVYQITLVSQATTALVLWLLAWADRRSRWLVPLAAACCLHAAAIYLMPLWRGTGRWLPHAFSAAILIVMLCLVYLGLQHHPLASFTLCLVHGEVRARQHLRPVGLSGLQSAYPDAGREALNA